jgi:oxygen-dependent protoporphyrinogen oxidase
VSPPVSRIVVVGAGITGLTAAYTLLRDTPGADVLVIDAADHAGGKISTTEFAGRPVDAAADAFLARVPEAVALCRELGLGDELVAPASRTAYLFTRGELVRFPEGLSLGVPTDLDALARSGVISAEGVARAAQDLDSPEPPRAPGPPERDDEAIGSLVRRRVGDEVFETLVAPLLSGVYAGNADELSAAVAAPQFLAAVRDHGSLIVGLRAQLAASASDAPVFYGLRGGTQRLVDALVQQVDARGGRLALGAAVQHVARANSHTRLDTARGESIEADAVVLAAPDFALAAMLRDASRSVAADLATIPYASVALVCFAVPRSGIPPLEGTGFLVPAREGLLLTACSWASSKWAHLDGDPVILRASAGRIDDRRAMTLNDDQLVARLVADLRHTMDLAADPIASRVSRWPDALPQFRPGHLHRVEAWRAALARDLPGVTLAGAGIGGLGIPACIRQGERAAADLLRRGVLVGRTRRLRSGLNDTPHLETTLEVPPDARRLLVVLHGYEDEPGLLAERLRSARADHRWASSAPAGPTRAAGGPAWFASLDGDEGPPLATTLDALERHARALHADHGLDAANTIVFGWSQGAAAALALALRAGGSWHPRIVVALSPWLVDEPDVEWDFAGARARGTHVLLVHGAGDDVVPVTQARSTLRVLDRAGVDVTLVEVDAGHDLPALLPPALAWLDAEPA